ncbi:hypothetical protein CRENBAI_014352, partial [Crenichthys baileyi]
RQSVHSRKKGRGATQEEQEHPPTTQRQGLHHPGGQLQARRRHSHSHPQQARHDSKGQSRG